MEAHTKYAVLKVVANLMECPWEWANFPSGKWKAYLIMIVVSIPYYLTK